MRKESGHKQMLSQAAAMLVSFPAFLAAEFGAVALPAFLDQGLAVTGSSDTSLLVCIVTRHVIELIIDGAPLHIDSSACCHELVGG